MNSNFALHISLTVLINYDKFQLDFCKYFAIWPSVSLLSRSYTSISKVERARDNF